MIESAEELAFDFFGTDPSSAPGGYDDLAGRGEPNRITTSDIVAINATMRARSPHAAWETLTASQQGQAWLLSIDQSWDLMLLEEKLWRDCARQAVAVGLESTVARGRQLSVATKVLHLKRPRIFPVLDSLVLEQLGATENVSPMLVIDHLRAEGRRNLDALREVQARLASRYDRSLVRIMDVLIWASHPAAGLAPSLREWQHVIRRVKVKA